MAGVFFMRYAILCLFLAGTSAADSYQVEFEVSLSKGVIETFTVEVYPDWAPLGAARFREIVQADIWNFARFFRVVSGESIHARVPRRPAGRNTQLSRWTTVPHTRLHGPVGHSYQADSGSCMAREDDYR